MLACQWGPLRILRNEAGHFRDATADLGFSRHRGAWNGVTTGDFDGDGRLDIMASNWGRNTPHPATPGPPLRVYYRDFDGDGSVEVLEAFGDPETGRIVPQQDFETVSRALPFLRASITTFRAYAEAALPAMLGPAADGIAEATIDTLDSMVFLNRGGTFQAAALPVEAQFAPAFGLSVGDYNGDGHEDVFLAPNFFGVTGETSRYDGGFGLWLEGDGHGGFTAVPAVKAVSGFPANSGDAPWPISTAMDAWTWQWARTTGRPSCTGTGAVDPDFRWNCSVRRRTALESEPCSAWISAPTKGPSAKSMPAPGTGAAGRLHPGPGGPTAPSPSRSAGRGGVQTGSRSRRAPDRSASSIRISARSAMS